MAKRSLILTSTSNQGKKLQKTITDINPNTGAVALKGFAQKLNAMTTNTYVQTDCIDKYNVDTEIPPVDTRQTPTISIDNVPTLAQIKSGSISSMAMITYSGDGVTYVRRNSGCNGVYFVTSGAPYQGQQTVAINKIGTVQVSDVTGGTYVVGATGTDNYKPIEVEYTLE